MILTVEEAPDYLLAMEVILKLRAADADELSSSNGTRAVVKLQNGDRLCGAIVESFERGPGSILMGKYLRANIGTRLGDTIQIERIIPPRATSIKVIVPNSYRGMNKTKKIEPEIREALIGKPVSQGNKVPLSIFAGEDKTVEIADITPPGIATVDESTKVEIEAGTSEGPGIIAYKDIGGLGDEVRLVRELIEFPLRFPELYEHLGINSPRGILLYGPPGTGKTLMVRALTNEIQASFHVIQGPEIMSSWYGESEKNLRDVFAKAEKNAPSIILIDEIDSIAPRRENVREGVERRVVTTLLSLMDGIHSLQSVVVVGTTNSINDIDRALRRPGRFEREVHIGVPSTSGREQILRIHTRGMPCAQDIDLKATADKTYGFVGADLTALCREAAYNALRRTYSIDAFEQGTIEVNSELKVTQIDFENALKTIKPSAMREVSVEIPKDINFAKIGGLDSAKQIIRDNVVNSIKNREAFTKVGIVPAKGIFLYGPPGTGKSLLARAIANECGINLISVKGPEILSKWMGESEERIRFLFAKAREVAPCVLLFDEIDAIAQTRSEHTGHYVDKVLNQILCEMDEIQSSKYVFVVAVTNVPDIIDPALIRSGRFDYKLYVPLPDEKAREEIFSIHLRQVPVARDISVNELAQMTDTCSGADIAEICREAGFQALREANFKPDGVKVGKKHFTSALTELKKARERINPPKPPMGFRADAKGNKDATN